MPAFARFLANDAQVARTIVQECFQILRDTWLGGDEGADEAAPGGREGEALVLRPGRRPAPPRVGRGPRAVAGVRPRVRRLGGREVDLVVGDESTVEVKATANVSDDGSRDSRLSGKKVC